MSNTDSTNPTSWCRIIVRQPRSVMRRTSPRAARLNSGAGGSGACWRDPRIRMRSWWRGVGESMRVCQVANGGGFLRAEGHDECIEAVAGRGCVAGCARRVYLRCAWNGARQRGVLCQWRTFCSLLSSVMAPWSPVELWKGEKKTLWFLGSQLCLAAGI